MIILKGFILINMGNKKKVKQVMTNYEETLKYNK
jgi:hypothetical protein